MGKEDITVSGEGQGERKVIEGKYNKAGQAPPLVLIDESSDSPEEIAKLIKSISDGFGVSFLIQHDNSSTGILEEAIEKIAGLAIVKVNGPVPVDPYSVYLIPRGIRFSLTEGIINPISGKPDAPASSGRIPESIFNKGRLLRLNIPSMINDAVISIDNRERITFFNPAAEKLYKISKEEALGKQLRDVVHYQFLSGEEKDFAYRSLEKRGYWKGDNIHVTSDGKKLYVESNVNLIRDEEGEMIGQLAVIHDITPRKELELSLQKKEDMLSAALYSARMFAFEWDPETDEVMRTRQCADILGISKNPTRDTSRKYFERIHPEDRESFIEMVRNLSPSNPTYSASYRIRRDDTGEYVVIGEKGKAHFDEQGGMVQLSGMAADITGRKHLEEELKRQNELLETVFDTIPVMITIYDPKLETFSFNREMKEVLGWTEDDAADGDYMAKVYPDPEYREMVSEYMQSLEQGWRDFRVTAKDGSVVESSWANIRLSDDRQVGIGIDIRKYLEAERVLARDKSKLEKLIREKTKEMLRIQKKINQENRLADIGKLAASVAHELRNPLATINISSFNLKNKTEGEDIHKHLDRIRKKVEEANWIIDNLLNYSRLRPPSREKFNLHDRLEEAVREIHTRWSFSDKNLKLEIEPVKDLEINADPYQLGEVLSNVLNNAFNATDGDHAEVVIEGRLEDGKAIIVIRDNGKGIEKKFLKKVFDPFFSTRAQGTGLGLAICRQIINSHDGNIDLTSEKGVGTTVTLSIPVESD